MWNFKSDIFRIAGDTACITGDSTGYSFALTDAVCTSCTPQTRNNLESKLNLLQQKGTSFSSDGTKLFISVHNDGAGSGAPDTIRTYSLSTPWNLLTSSVSTVATSIDLNQDGESAVFGHYFSPDGTLLFTCGTSLGRVVKYSLSTPWDVSTTSYVGYLTLTSSPTYIDFSPDGIYMFIVASTLKRYTLSTPWDINTAVETQSIAFTSHDISLQNNGYYLFSIYGGVLTKKTLSTAYDLTTVSSTNTLDLSGSMAIGTNFESISFKDGHKFFIGNYTGNSPANIYAFELSCSFDISGPII
jgi:hypothetical protein